MTSFVPTRLFVRLVALATLVCSLVLVTLRPNTAQQQSSHPNVPTFTQTKMPIIVAKNALGSPLTISAAHSSSTNPQDTEISFNVTNVGRKVITAFSFSQELEADHKTQQTITTNYLELSDRNLQPNGSMIDYSSYEPISEEQHHVTLSIEFVRFSDGTTWGIDSAKSAERIAGQRAAVYILSRRLLKILNKGNAGDVMLAVKSGATNIDPPAARSEEWKEGFRLASSTLAHRLTEAEGKGGWVKVEVELRKLVEAFKGEQ